MPAPSPVLPPLAPRLGADPAGPRVAPEGAAADGRTLDTVALQAAIDRAAEVGGWVVLSAGTWRSGALRLRSGVGLRLEAGAVLLGSDDWRDYGTGAWRDALLTAEDAIGIRIEGEGVIDGADCFNPRGEAGQRGPHGLWLERCRDIIVRGVRFRRIGNWGVAAWRSSDLAFEGMQVHGGHDGIDLGDCARVRIAGCDLRTGDDCLAGPGNRDVEITDSALNSSCNAVRFSCERFAVRRTRIWGPGEHEHRFHGGRTNLLAAFVHFSPHDRGYRGPTPHSDHWLVEDCTVDHADCLYEYDGGHFWQDARGVGRVVFRGVTARGFVQPVTVYGVARSDDRLARRCRLEFEDVTLEPRAGREDCGFFDLRRHHSLTLRRVRLLRNASSAPVRALDGGPVVAEDVSVEPCAARPADRLLSDPRFVIPPPADVADGAEPDLTPFAAALAGAEPAGAFRDGALRGRWLVRPGEEDLLVAWSIAGPVRVRVRGGLRAASDAAGRVPDGVAAPASRPAVQDDVATCTIGPEPVLLRGTGIGLVVG